MRPHTGQEAVPEQHDQAGKKEPGKAKCMTLLHLQTKIFEVLQLKKEMGAKLWVSDECTVLDAVKKVSCPGGGGSHNVRPGFCGLCRPCVTCVTWAGAGFWPTAAGGFPCISATLGWCTSPRSCTSRREVLGVLRDGTVIVCPADNVQQKTSKQ